MRSTRALQLKSYSFRVEGQCTPQAPNGSKTKLPELMSFCASLNAGRFSLTVMILASREMDRSVCHPRLDDSESNA